VAIQVTERHVGQRTIDPAAETELALFCRELGFTVVDNAPGSRGEADVLLTGEGFSEFAARHGQLVSVRARLELKAVERRTGRVLAVGRRQAQHRHAGGRAPQQRFSQAAMLAERDAFPDQQQPLADFIQHRQAMALAQRHNWSSHALSGSPLRPAVCSLPWAVVPCRATMPGAVPSRFRGMPR
jgi:hypothetical protein